MTLVLFWIVNSVTQRRVESALSQLVLVSVAQQELNQDAEGGVECFLKAAERVGSDMMCLFWPVIVKLVYESAVTLTQCASAHLLFTFSHFFLSFRCYLASMHFNHLSDDLHSIFDQSSTRRISVAFERQ